jgi:uncharacterized protein
VSDLQIPLSAVPEEGFAVEAETSSADLRPEGAAELSMGPIRITGTLAGDGYEFVFNGRMTGTYLGTCDRCLGPAEVSFATQVLWVFAEGSPVHPFDDSEDEENEDIADDGVIRASFEGNMLDLSAAAWEEAVLGAPLKLLCSDSCAGLCPVCGTNLNESRCDCAGQVNDTPFADTGLKGLKDLFPGVDDDRLEE